MTIPAVTLAFGGRAQRWLETHADASGAAIVVDYPDIATAIPIAIGLRAAGRPCGVRVLIDERRTLLLRALYGSIEHGAPTIDGLLRTLDSFAAQQLVLNGRGQAEVESGFMGPGLAFRDMATIADYLVFRSHREQARAEEYFGFSPRRSRIDAAPSTLVPLPARAMPRASGGIAVWAVGVPDADVRAFAAATFDLRSPRSFIAERAIDGVHVTPVETALPALEGARVLVCLDDDPGVVAALARFERGMCAPLQSGADELLHDVEHFSIWDRLGTVDAVLRAQGTVAMHAPARPARDACKAHLSPLFSNDPPLVSIVMPTYSRPDRLRDNLTRLQHQTYPNIEIIVVNNAGTPVESIVEGFGNARLINRCENTGNATAPRNDGYRNSAGAYVTFLDDDDYYFPDHVTAMVAALRNGCHVAYSDWLIRIVEVRLDGTENELGWDLIKNDGLSTYELLVNNPVGYMTIFARRAAYESVGMFDGSDEALGGEEQEMWLRLSHEFDFVHVNRPTSAYTIRQTWDGQATAANYKLFAHGYENIYRTYPAHDMPSILARREANLTEMRKSDRPPPYPVRYPAAR